MPYVANIPAQKTKTRKGTRFSWTRKDSHRKESSCTTSCEGTQASRPKSLIPFSGRALSMIKKQKQARVSRELFALLSRPKNIHSSQYVALRRFSSPPSITKPLFVVTVSKKEVPSAVKRNLLKRRYRAILQKVFSQTPPGVVQGIVKKSALTAKHKDLVEDAMSALSRIS